MQIPDWAAAVWNQRYGGRINGDFRSQHAYGVSRAQCRVEVRDRCTFRSFQQVNQSHAETSAAPREIHYSEVVIEVSGAERWP